MVAFAGMLGAERGFVCTSDDLSGVVGSSAKGSNLMKGGGCLERMEEDLRRPPGLAKAGLLLAMVVVEAAAMMGLVDSEP